MCVHEKIILRKTLFKAKTGKCAMLSVMSSSASMHRNFAGSTGGLGVLPQEIIDFRVVKKCILVLLGCFNQIPLPPPLQKYFLFRFTLISRMALISRMEKSLKSVLSLFKE